MFFDYLLSVEHPKANAIKASKPTKIKIDWSTKDNFTDCGVYVMRHMELFKGKGNDFDCGFSDIPSKRTKQIKQLRMKYATKILLSNANCFKKKMLDDANEWDKILKQTGEQQNLFKDQMTNDVELDEEKSNEVVVNEETKHEEKKKEESKLKEKEVNEGNKELN